jgi:hypothetical protein
MKYKKHLFTSTEELTTPPRMTHYKLGGAEDREK